jgi:hypothetical protein
MPKVLILIVMADLLFIQATNAFALESAQRHDSWVTVLRPATAPPMGHPEAFLAGRGTDLLVASSVCIDDIEAAPSLVVIPTEH